MTSVVWIVDPAQMVAYYDRALCAALAAHGLQVRLIASRYLYDNALPAGVTFDTSYLYFRGLERRWLLRTPRLRKVLRAVSYLLGHRALIQQVRATRPDIFHLQWSRLPRLDYVLVRQVRAAGIPVIHTVHDVIPLFDSNKKTDYLGLIYGAADGLIVHAEANRAELVQTYPHLASAKIAVLPHLSLTDGQAPSEASRQTARTLLGLPENVFVIGFCGSIKAYKGLDILIAAFQQAMTQRPDLPLHLLIAGRPESAADTAPLAVLQNRLNVTIHTDYIPYNQLWAYHYAADVMAFPYRRIYQSGALITAMGFGCPVIASRVGAIPETVDGNGWLVPPEDPASLAEAILMAATQPDILIEKAAQSRRLIAELYSGESVAAQHTLFYRTIRERKPG